MQIIQTRILIIATILCGCLLTSSCQEQADPPQSNILSVTNMTAVDFEKAKAKFKSTSGDRTTEARLLAPLITQGMTKDQVHNILGEPDKKGTLASSDNVWNYTVYYSQAITVLFDKDKVLKTETVGIE